MTEASTPSAPRSRAAVAQRRQRILRAAVDLFAEKGYLGATTDEIAAAAGVTKRTLYRHMGSKDHLLYAIHEDFIDEGLARWEKVVEEEECPPRELLGKLIRAHVDTVIEYQKAIRVFFEEWKHLPEEDRAVIRQRREAYERILRDVLRRGMASGDFRRLDLRVATLSILGALTEIYRWYHEDGRLGRDELEENLERSLVSGLTA